MAYQTVFKRYELKYIITTEQMDAVLAAMEPYMEPDSHGRSTVRNIYYDSEDFILARHSIAKPDFKEKLRIRSYSQADADSEVFVELKRKYDHVVYKRRVALPEHTAMRWTAPDASMKTAPKADTKTAPAADAVSPQIADEIDYFLDYYGDLRPAAYISYDRIAFKAKDPEHGDFRVTFDNNILFRDYDLSLRCGVYGKEILEQGKILMELKCAGGMPVWMADVLSSEHIYKTSFSKYGKAYQEYILPSILADNAGYEPVWRRATRAGGQIQNGTVSAADAQQWHRPLPRRSAAAAITAFISKFRMSRQMSHAHSNIR